MKKTIVFLSCLLLISAGLGYAKEVPINPITQDIKDKLKESTKLVTNVEDSMAPKVNDLETVFKTYTETCKESKNDKGCVEIQNQIREMYKELLNTMAEDLPKVKNTINATARELGSSIRAKTRTKDIKGLYEHVAKKGKLPKIRGPLSKKLSEMLKAMGRPSSNVSILEMSLQTQADLIAASEILEFLEAKIDSQVIMIDIQQDFGVLSPEMASVMKGVAELFGYDVDFGPAEIEETGSPGDWSK